MRVGLRILRSGNQDLGLRENTLQFWNERNRTAFTLVDRSHAKSLFHGFHGILGGFGIRIHGPAHAIIKLVDPHLGTERGMFDHECCKRLLGLFRTLVRGGA